MLPSPPAPYFASPPLGRARSTSPFLDARTDAMTVTLGSLTASFCQDRTIWHAFLLVLVSRAPWLCQKLVPPLPLPLPTRPQATPSTLSYQPRVPAPPRSGSPEPSLALSRRLF